jgi:hypothetical protein
MADLLREAEALEASSRQLKAAAQGLGESSEAEHFKEIAAGMDKKAAAKREARKALKPEDQIRTERERDLTQKRERLVKARQRLTSTATAVAEHEEKLSKLKAQYKETEELVERLDDAITKLYAALGRRPEDDEDEDSSSQADPEEEDDMDVVGVTAAADGLRAACSGKVQGPRLDEELREDMFSVCSGATGGGKKADERRSRSPPGGRKGLERPM